MRGRSIRFGLPLVLIIAAAGAAAALAATAATHTTKGTVSVAHNKTYGTILVAANGRTLYRYTVDGKNVNRCSSNATCNKFWPALLVKPGKKPTAGAGVRAALLGTIKAAHGMRQVTYAGFPLYFFSEDKAAGQLKGQGFGSKWYVVGTNGALVTHAMTTPSGGGTTTTGGGGGGGGGWG